MPGLDVLLKRTTDQNFNVRRQAISTIAAYRNTGDARIEEALRSALLDPKHKVKHAAARALGVPCLGCGKVFVEPHASDE